MVVEPQGTSQPQPSELETPMAPETTVDRDLQEAAVTCQQTWFLTGAVTCIGDLVRRAGPERVLRAVAQAIEAGDIDGSTDTHSLAHEVGRQTARVFGLGGQAFLGCSIAFNYGCQHGFFEQALASSPNATEAAIAICEDLVGSEPTKTVFYCYHGVGHGVMMASAYDLDVALEVCDSLGEAMASDGCWQGVFMENVNSVMRGEAREGVFSDSDPLAPCNRVADRHKWECYINHAGRLITLFDLSVRDASHACLDAAGRFVLACVQSLDLMVSNLAWQATLVGPTSHGRNIEVTLELCGRFPEEYRRDCLIGAVDNIMNFDGVALDRALRFCRATDGPDREPLLPAHRIRHRRSGRRAAGEMGPVPGGRRAVPDGVRRRRRHRGYRGRSGRAEAAVLRWSAGPSGRRLCGPGFNIPRERKARGERPDGHSAQRPHNRSPVRGPGLRSAVRNP